MRYWAQHTLAWRRILKCDWFIAGSAVVVDLVIYVDPVRCVVSTLPFHALHFPYCFVLALFGRSMHVAIPDRDSMHVAILDRDKVVTTTTATTTVTVVTSFLSVVVVTIFVLCSGHFFPPCSGGHDLCPFCSITHDPVLL